MDRRRLLALALISGLAPAVGWPVAAQASKPKAEAEADKKSGGTSYIAIATLTATVVKPGGRRGVMTVDCGIDVPNKALHDKAQLILPRLRAAFIQTVQIYAAGMPLGPPPSIDYLSRELQRQTDVTLGTPGAKLLLGSVLLN